MKEKRSALLVEDNPDFSKILTRLLTPWDLEIVTTGSAAEAIEMIQTRSFDYYSVDLQLADGSAAGLLSLLKSQGETTFSRCVVVTAFGIVAPAFTDCPVVPKTNLAGLGHHLLRILGTPDRPRVGVTA